MFNFANPSSWEIVLLVRCKTNVYNGNADVWMQNAVYYRWLFIWDYRFKYFVLLSILIKGIIHHIDLISFLIVDLLCHNSQNRFSICIVPSILSITRWPSRNLRKSVSINGNRKKKKNTTLSIFVTSWMIRTKSRFMPNIKPKH